MRGKGKAVVIIFSLELLVMSESMELDCNETGQDSNNINSTTISNSAIVQYNCELSINTFYHELLVAMFLIFDAGSGGSGTLNERPSTIPRAPHGLFTGRDDILAALEEKLLERQLDATRCFTISGTFGIGKSEVCLKFIEKHREL